MTVEFPPPSPPRIKVRVSPLMNSPYNGRSWESTFEVVPRVGEMIEVDPDGGTAEVISIIHSPFRTPGVVLRVR